MSDLSEQARESREKILSAAKELFSTKGFDGTSVREISEKSNVKKALIFYYFKNKEEILQSLLDTFILEMKQEAIKRLSEERYGMQQQGKLTFQLDKFKYSHSDNEAIDRHMDAAIRQSLDFYLNRKAILRILFDESLKKGSHSSILFRITDLLRDQEEEGIPNTLGQHGYPLQIDNKSLVERFFTGLMPMLSFVVYFDEWKAHYKMSDEECKDAFVQSYKTTYGNHYR